MESGQEKNVPTFQMESIMEIAKKNGIRDIQDTAVEEVAANVTFHIKSILRDAALFMMHGIKDELNCQHIDLSLKLRNIEPVYGFSPYDRSPFGLSSGDGNECTMTEEDNKILNLQEKINNFAPKSHADVSLKIHWLAIDGIEPTVPENPPPFTDLVQQMENLNPLHKLKHDEINKEILAKPCTSKDLKVKAESNRNKVIVSRELSTDQQLAYKQLTESCVGNDDQLRTKALNALQTDKGLHHIMPHLCIFITEGVRINIVCSNLATLIYLMRATRAITDNPTLYIGRYLHELLPSVITCVVSKQLSARPDDNHWALRDFSSRLLADMCKICNTDVNKVQTRVIRILSNAVIAERTPLTTLYGCIKALSELGDRLVDSFIISKTKQFSDKLEPYLEDPNFGDKADRIAATHIKNLLLKILPPTIIERRLPSDTMTDYVNNYGYLGGPLHAATIQVRSNASQ